MRAEYVCDLGDFAVGDRVYLERKTHRHLVHIARVRLGEELLLLDGRGLSAQGVVESVERGQVVISLQAKESRTPWHEIDLAMGLCKKDALDLGLRMAVELGVRKFIPLRTEFSQKHFIRSERVERILISALKQSNAYFFPQVGEVMELAALDFSVYREVFCFSLGRGGDASPARSLDGGRGMVLIGPEGGLSEREEAVLASCERISFVRLPTNILRSTTALAAAMGYVLPRD